MGCLGVHLAVERREACKLRSLSSDAARLAFVQEELEDLYFARQRQWLAETDKAWDAIHRALTDGELGWDNGTYPLNHVILGGERLYNGDDYNMKPQDAS